MLQVPNHPFAQYETGYDAHGQFWVRCRCTHCGDTWQKPCSQPQRASLHVYRYALQHGHGFLPQQVRR